MSPQPPSLPLPPKKNAFDRNLKWLIPMIVLLGFALVVGFILTILGVIRSSDAYQGALARIRKSPAAVEVLGEPVHDGLWFTGEIKIVNSEGGANLTIPIAGSRTKATAYVIGKRSLGQWHYPHLILIVDGSERRIDLSEQINPESISGRFDSK